MSVSNRIKEVLYATKTSGLKLASLTGIPQPTISWQLNNDRVNDRLICGIINAFPNISENWLRTGEGDMLVDGKEIIESHIPMFQQVANVGINKQTVSVNQTSGNISSNVDVKLREENVTLKAKVGQLESQIELLQSIIKEQLGVITNLSQKHG